MSGIAGFLRSFWPSQPVVEEKKPAEVTKIVPMFYEIRDARTNEKKGCLLGAFHDLRSLLTGLNQKIETSDLFDEKSKVQKCFNDSSVFASEVQMMDFVNLEVMISGEEKAKELLSDLQKNAINSFAMDSLFELTALAKGKEVKGLETLAETINDRKREEKIPSRSIWSRLPEKCNSATVYRAFLEGSEEQWQFMNEQCVLREKYAMMIERNQRMAQRADAIFKDSTTNMAFLTIGAAHLPGKDGVLALLQNRGWVLERVYEDAK